MSTQLNQTLDEIDALEAEYWHGWENCDDQSKPGNLRFLSGVQWCIEQRIKLLGLLQKSPDLQLAHFTLDLEAGKYQALDGAPQRSTDD